MRKTLQDTQDNKRMTALDLYDRDATLQTY